MAWKAARDVADPKIEQPRLSPASHASWPSRASSPTRRRIRTSATTASASCSRKANPLGETLYSFIVAQHRQSTDWLASLPFVDPERIAFYGLSYGGKTAMRVPALVERYCLSICSGDFNEWIWKCTSLRLPVQLSCHQRIRDVRVDLGNTFNYAEMAGLIAPRPFMVERGHHDGVGIDEWVAYEYAKVRRSTTTCSIADRTTIEFFDGPHTIHGVGTFEFLHEQLNWPQTTGK